MQLSFTRSTNAVCICTLKCIWFPLILNIEISSITINPIVHPFTILISRSIMPFFSNFTSIFYHFDILHYTVNRLQFTDVFFFSALVHCYTVANNQLIAVYCFWHLRPSFTSFFISTGFRFFSLIIAVAVVVIAGCYFSVVLIDTFVLQFSGIVFDCSLQLFPILVKTKSYRLYHECVFNSVVFFFKTWQVWV